MIRLGVIGMGSRGAWMVSQVQQCDPEVKLSAVADPDHDLVRRRMQQWKVASDGVKLYNSADEMLQYADRFDAFMIGTRCHLHTPMAVKIAPLGLPLFLEKPVAITAEQHTQLAAAYRGRESSVVVSFPLRLSPLFQTVLQIVRSGRLGIINQIQAFNNVSYGGVYFGNWYRNYDQVGGLWLQKATHDFDYINSLMSCPPRMITAMTTQVIYGGTMPFELRCSKCDLTETCVESPKNQKLRNDDGGMGEGPGTDHFCCFSEGIKNEDAGSAIIQYADGSHAAYSQNFVSRRSAGRRGASITGYSATLEFEWISDQIKLIEHHADRVDQITVKPVSGHFGGDTVLARNFVDVIREKDQSKTDLSAGLLSVAMCLAARESSQTHTFQEIPPTESVELLRGKGGGA